MYKLAAKFDFKVPELPGFLIASLPNNEQPDIKVEIKDYVDYLTGQSYNYEVKTTLISEGGPRTGNIDSSNYACFINRMVIYVERQESEEIPKNEFLKINFFSKRIREFQKVAIEILSRLILFFKFKLHNALLNYTDPQLLLMEMLVKKKLKPTWFKDNTEIQLDENICNKAYPAVFGAPHVGFLTTTIGNVKKFTVDINDELIGFLNNPVQPQLYQELFSDAQDAAFHNHFRRAILELAISCEVFVKQFFFEKSSVSGLAFEFLESRQKINVRIIDLIDGVAKYCFGESFKDNNEEDYKNIDYIFRCRNKIAHRGEIEFRDDQGILHKTDYKMLGGWFESFLLLVAWLNNKK